MMIIHMCELRVWLAARIFTIVSSGHIHDNDMAQRSCPPTYVVEILCKNPGLSCDTVMHQGQGE